MSSSASARGIWRVIASLLFITLAAGVDITLVIREDSRGELFPPEYPQPQVFLRTGVTWENAEERACYTYHPAWPRYLRKGFQRVDFHNLDRNVFAYPIRYDIGEAYYQLGSNLNSACSSQMKKMSEIMLQNADDSLTVRGSNGISDEGVSRKGNIVFTGAMWRRLEAQESEACFVKPITLEPWEEYLQRRLRCKQFSRWQTARTKVLSLTRSHRRRDMRPPIITEPPTRFHMGNGTHELVYSNANTANKTLYLNDREEEIDWAVWLRD
ncbi:MAG: hypothetical protein M1833_007144 [Piccolia ochrophora]|nr:MAG: hypothetical protein M1833_007144 [Piccolia ochrophora]